MHVEVVPAVAGDRERLANLLELYIHDLSEFVDLCPGEDGRFGYERLDSYWSEPGRYANLIRADGRLAGFALVSRGSQVSGDPSVFDVAEFFVVRALRHSRVGSAAARMLFSSLAGKWEVRVMERNVAGRLFWERVVGEFAGAHCETLAWQSPRGRRFRVFRFASPGPATG